MKVNPADRFWPKVEKHGRKGCWVWLGAINKYGYGVFRGYDSKDTKSHIFSYELHKGRIPIGLQLDHLCRNRACCNPEHLEAVSPKENLMRGIPYRREKTHCRNGHAFTNDNILFNKNTSQGKRYKTCRTCRREANILARSKKDKQIWLAGFKAGIDAKSCCCNGCTLHSMAVEEKMTKDMVGDGVS